MSLNFRALSSIGLSIVRCCFSFRWPAFDMSHHISGHKWSDLVVTSNFWEPLPGPHIFFRWFFIQYRELREFWSWVWQTKIHIDVPIIVNTAFLQHVPICLCTSGHVNVFHWYWRMFLLSAPEAELEGRRDDEQWNLLRLTNNHCGHRRHLLFRLLVDLSEFRWRSPLSSSLLTSWSSIEVDFGNSIKSSRQFYCTICDWEYQISPFSDEVISFALRLRAWISDASKSSSSSTSATQISPFQIHTREQCISIEFSRSNCLTKLMEPWLVFRINSVVFNHGVKRNLCQEASGIAQVTVAFHRISPPFFIQAGLQQYCRRPFFSFCVSSFQQYHLSRIDGTSTYNDSMISLHKICQIPMKCQVRKDDFSFSDGSRHFR